MKLTFDKNNPEVAIFELEEFEDHRGSYVETYNLREMNNLLIDTKEHGLPEFVQDDFSSSKQNVLRGLHGDEETWKLITCAKGKFELCLLNVDEESPFYGKSSSIFLSEKNRKAVLVPPMYANGHYCLEDSIFCYKQSQYYNPTSQFSYHWSSVTWNSLIATPILSKRDAGASLWSPTKKTV